MAFLKDYIAVKNYLTIFFKKLQQLNLLLIFSLCCLLAYFFLPQPYRNQILQLRRYTLVLELAFIIYLFTRFSRLRKHYQLLQSQFPDIAYNTRDSLIHIMGKRIVYRFAATEFVILTYAIKLWGTEKQDLEDYTYYSVYKESGYLTVWIAFITVIIIETAAVHFLLYKRSYGGAIAMTGLSIYGLFFFISDFNAIVKRPVLIGNSRLILRMGYRWRCITALDNILLVETNNGETLPDPAIFVGSIMKSTANLKITFKEPVTIDRIMKKGLICSVIILNIDQYKEFIARLQ